MKWTKYYLGVLVGISYFLCLFAIVTNLFFGAKYTIGGIAALAVFTIFFSVIFVLND